MQSRDRAWLVLVLFFCSGATALVYEVIWSKFLSQMFGSTIYAQTVVLAAFMGGLALGNRLFGKWADRLAQPVRAYGYLELAIGIYAFFFAGIDQAADRVFVSVGTGIAENPGWLLLLKAALSAALLLGPTTLMGGTLPLLAAWLQKTSPEAGRRSARFYSVNSLGAVAGSALAGFWLVQNLGMVASLQMTALANVLVGSAAILLSRQLTPDAPPTEATAEPAPSLPPEPLGWAALIVALSGGVSMGLEVLASRSLALVFGSSLQSFALVLMAFILGIGLGSAWIASPRRKMSGEQTVAILLTLAAAWVALLVYNIESGVNFYRIASIGLGRNPVGYVYHELLAAGIALAALGWPAACIGAVLPLMIRSVSGTAAPLGARVGALLTWNTLGAVAGTLLTGFFLMPLAGLRNAFAVLACTLAAIAVTAAWRRRWTPGIALAATALALSASLFAFGGQDWRHIMSSGVFRSRETEFDPSTLPLRKQHMKILFYEDAPDATVTVEQGDGIGAPADIGLRINGKPDASTRVDLSTQLLVAHLPMLARPGARDVFILGLGSGVSGGALLSYPVDRIDIAENCDPVIRAGRFFEPWNRHVLDDPRVRVWREDARTVLKLRPQLYDVIITQPSNPWTVGVGSVFSREYYNLAASRLKPGGVVAQWFHVYEMHDGIVGLVLRTFSSVFPFVEVWDASGGDIILVGSMQPWTSGPDVYARGFALEGVRLDMNAIGIRSPDALWTRQLASQRTGFAIPGGGPVQSDWFPVLEYAAPEAFYIGLQSRMLEKFDERTWQQLLAPREKQSVLKQLPQPDAESVFNSFGSVNHAMLAALHEPAGGTNSPVAFGAATFRPPPPSALDRALAALNDGNLPLAEQLAAEGVLSNPASAQAAYLQRIVARAAQLNAPRAGVTAP
ncbi:MAG: fused MFS/spermidine synthase [Verrucomicrobiota bacterium]